MNQDLSKLLRAIASGSNAKEARHDIIFDAAADKIESLTRLLLKVEDEWFGEQNISRSLLKEIRGALALTSADHGADSK